MLPVQPMTMDAAWLLFLPKILCSHLHKVIHILKYRFLKHFFQTRTVQPKSIGNHLYLCIAGFSFFKNCTCYHFRLHSDRTKWASPLCRTEHNCETIDTSCASVHIICLVERQKTAAKPCSSLKIQLKLEVCQISSSSL